MWPTPHLANFRHSRALGLRRRQCPEHAVTYRARPRPRHPWSTPSSRLLCPRPRSLRPEHAAASGFGARRRPRLLRRRPRPRLLRRRPRLYASPTPPDRAVHSTPSFPSSLVIHEKLMKYCRILSSSTKIELLGHSGS
jgi:hypothetical protein